MTFTNQIKIAEILDYYNIRFNLEDKFELEPDQNLSIIPPKQIVNMVGVKNDKGHRVFFKKLNQMERDWLLVYFKYENYYEVYNTKGEIINENFYILINEILDGLR